MKTLNQAEAEASAARKPTPRVAAVAEGKIRYGYQYAVEMTELAIALEQELARAQAQIHGLEIIAKAAHRDKVNAHIPAHLKRKAVSAAPPTSWAPLEALTNEEVYEQLKKYRCFGMTTRGTQ